MARSLPNGGSYGSGNGQLNRPDGVTVDSLGNIYVADTYNNRIQKFDINGTFIDKWGYNGTSDGQFVNPKSVAVDSSGDVYVADTENHRVQKFFGNGSFITKWGSLGNGDGQFVYTQDAAVDSSGNVYVVDLGNDRIQKFAIGSKTALPVANFSTNVTNGYAPLSVQFNDSSVNAETVSWDFGDGNTSSGQNPLHTYYAAGTYTVNLTAFNGNGTNSTSTTITVLEKSAPVLPIANFTTNVTSGYAPLSIQFNDLSNNASSRMWDFGDGTNSTQQNPVHAYYRTGNYIVNLTVSNEHGTDSKSITINVNAVSVAYITNYGSANVSVVNTAVDNVITSVIVGANPQGVAFSPDGTRVYVTNYGSGTVSVINTTTNTVTDTFTGLNGPAGIVLTSDGKTAYVVNSGYASSTVSVINTTTKDTSTVTVGTYPYGIAISHDEKRLYVTNTKGTRGNTVSIIDTATNSVTNTVPVGNTPLGVLVSPDDSLVYVANQASNSISVIDTPTNSVIATVPVGTSPFGFAITQDGKKLYVTNKGTNTVSVIDTATNSITKNVSVGASPEGLSFTHDGTKLYVVNYGSNSVSVINPVTDTVTGTFAVGTGPVALGQFTLPAQPQKGLPVANFSANVTSGILPLIVQFTDLSKNAMSSNWDFGDGTNSTDENPVHTYSVTGKYIINLTAINSKGKDSKTTAINVLEPAILPVANFSTNVSSGYVPLTVQFNDSSVNADTVSWDFDNNGDIDSIDRNPIYEFANFGTYIVNLTAANGNGTNSTFATIIVLEKPVSLLPVANFSTNVSEGFAPLSVQFTDLSENATEWRWDFDNNGVIDFTDRNPMFKFAASGIYTVNLTVSNDNGTDSKSAIITVREITVPILPVANFSTNVSEGYTPLTVQFTDLSENATEWNWDFGDGTNSTEQNPAHIYTVAGIYTVNLTVSNANSTDSKHAKIMVNFGNLRTRAYITNVNDGTVSIIDTVTNKIVDTIKVGNTGKVAVTPDGKKVYLTRGGNSFSIIDTVTNTVNATIYVGTWDLTGFAITPDGTKLYGASRDGNVYVIDTETNNVTGKVTLGGHPEGVAVTPDGTKVYVANWYSKNVSVIDTANNTIIGSVNLGLVDHPFGVAVSPDGKMVYVTNREKTNIFVIDTSTNTVTTQVSVGWWPFGVAVTPDGKKVYVANEYDNTTSVIDTETKTVIATLLVGKSPQGVAVTPDGTEVYVANFGSNNVSVIDIATDTVKSSVNVGNGPVAFGQFIGPLPLPKANFTSNVTQGVVPVSVQFTDLSKNTVGRSWDFGDGNTSTEQNPAHTYLTAGNYTVNLTVSNEKGVDSKLVSITVYPVFPVANFTSNVTFGYAPLTVKFMDLSQNATEWNWDFGDGNTSTEQNPEHVYIAAGNYTVNLTVSNANGTNSKLDKILVGTWVPAKDAHAYITNSIDNTVSVIDTMTKKVTDTVPVGISPQGVAVTPDGKKVYVTTYNPHNNLQVIDTATNSVNAEINVGTLAIKGIALTSDGTKLFVANDDRNIYVIDTATNNVTGKILTQANLFEGIAVTPDGTKVYVTDYYGTVSVIDTATNSIIAEIPLEDSLNKVAVTPDGKNVYVTNSGFYVYVIDTTTNNVTSKVPLSGSDGIAFTPDGKKAYVTFEGSGNVSVIDTASKSVTASVPVGQKPMGVAVTPDGTEVYVANFGSNNVSVIDIATDTVKSNVNVGNGPVAFGQFIGPLSPPIANFTSNITQGVVPVSVQFTDLSKNTVGRNWDFGDGNTSTEQNPAHTYTEVGNYTVNLTISNERGADSKLVSITVYPVLPNFTSNATRGFAPLSVQFNDTSAGVPTKNLSEKSIITRILSVSLFW